MSRGSDPVSIMQLDRPMRCRSWVTTFMFVKRIYESQERDGVWLHGKVTQHNTKKKMLPPTPPPIHPRTFPTLSDCRERERTTKQRTKTKKKKWWWVCVQKKNDWVQITITAATNFSTRWHSNKVVSTTQPVPRRLRRHVSRGRKDGQQDSFSQRFWCYFSTFTDGS